MARRIEAASVTNICPKVYETGQYSSTGAAKAAELTSLLQSLLVYGVFQSIDQAVSLSVPAGTFVVIDDPRTPEIDFTVEIVPESRRR